LFKIIKEKFNAFVLPRVSLEREIVGIDLSHHLLRVVQLTNKKTAWALTRIASRELDAKLVDESYYRHVSDTLAEVRAQENFDTLNAAVSLPINDAIVQVILIPYLEDALLRTAIENGSLWQGYINLPEDLSAYSIFWQVVSSDTQLNRMSILFVASSLDKVERLTQVVRDAGFNPVFIDVRCFALRNLLKLYEASEEVQETSALLEVSGYENYIVMIHNDLPFVYDIFVTDTDIAALIGGNELGEAVFMRIASQVEEKMNLFRTQSGCQGLREINLVSSLRDIEVLTEGLQQNLGNYMIKPLDALERLSISPALRSSGGAINPTRFAVALGLATRRLDVLNSRVVKAVANINLLPNRTDLIEKEREISKSQIKANKVSLYLFILMALIATIDLTMTMTLPTADDLAELEAKTIEVQANLEGAKQRFNEFNLWAGQVEGNNIRLSDFTLLSEIPEGVYVMDFKLSQIDLCELVLQSRNPSLVSIVVDKMNKKYKNVKLISVETDADDSSQVSKIIFQLKES
jgi:type IV pilus assembly protein PilN